MSPRITCRNSTLSRRDLLALLAATSASSLFSAQQPSLAHADVATFEHDRILSEARTALAQPVVPVLATPAPHGPAITFLSETEPDIRTAGGANPPPLFRAHARALREFSATVACFAAANLLTPDPVYTARAAAHLRANLLAPATALKPAFDLAGCAPGTTNGTPAGVVDLVPLAELARALSFFIDTLGENFLTAAEWDTLQAWFAALADWLNTARAPLIARDTKDHRASAWLLIASAIARFTRNEQALEDCRKLFRKPTLRNQIRADGVFPQEVATPNPYRNTLFNFDLLAGACQLLSSPFDQLWQYQLIDEVGLRSATAYLYTVIAHPEQWAFEADAVAFRDLPRRRAGLLFAGRAYNRPEYVETWLKLPGGPPPDAVAASIPIRQPLLWTARALHGL